MRAIFGFVLVAGLVSACGSEKPARNSTVDNRAVRERYLDDLSDVERQLGCGIAEVLDHRGKSEREDDRLLRRVANAYRRAARRLKALHPPRDAVAPNANLTLALSYVVDRLRLGVVGLTDVTGRLTDKSIRDAFLPPAAEKALDELRARGYPGDFEPSNCDDADLLSPSTKA